MRVVTDAARAVDDDEVVALQRVELDLLEAGVDDHATAAVDRRRRQQERVVGLGAVDDQLVVAVAALDRQRGAARVG